MDMDMDNKEEYHRYLVFIGTEGLEGMFLVPSMEDILVSVLKDEDVKRPFLESIHKMDFRCRMNSHRDIKRYNLLVQMDEFEMLAALQKLHFCEYIRERHTEG